MRFYVLDSWRGVAALAVALFHLTIAGHFFDLYMVRNGKFFVDFFFVLSGFVIAHSYQNYAGGEQAGFFLIKRFARIAPLHYFTLFIFFLIEATKYTLVVLLGFRSGDPPFTGQTSIGAIGANLFLLQGMNICEGWTWNIPSWSISVEFYAYTIFAFLICFFNNNLRNRLIVSICILSGIYLFISAFEGFYTDQKLAFVRCTFEFFAGMITFRLYLQTKHKAKLKETEIPLIILIIILLSYLEKSHLIFIVPFLFSVTVFVFAHEQGSISNLLRNEKFQHLGRISYSIYMTHFIILTLLNSGTRVVEQFLRFPLREVRYFRGEKFDLLTVGGPWLLDVLAILYILLIIRFSDYTYYNIEIPFQKYIQNWGKRLFRPSSSAL